MAVLTYFGTLVRLERDGFGIIKFDKPIGAHANNYGIISNSSGTLVSTPALVDGDFKPGTRVTGTAEADDHDLAAIKTLEVAK